MKRKKYLLSFKERKDFCWGVSTIEFRWTISRGYDTYGYNICSLWINGREKVASTCGGGYDMRGTCLGQFIRKYFPEALKKLKSSEYYGLTFWDPKAEKARKHYREGYEIYLDGACGFSTMETFLRSIGLYLGNPVVSKTNLQVYQIKPFKGEFTKER